MNQLEVLCVCIFIGIVIHWKMKFIGISLEMTLILGNIEGGRRRDQQRMRWLYGITVSMDMSLSKPESW